MDEMVLKAMQKWPNVPDVFGWLRLDGRGQWLLRTGPEQFDRIGNQGLVDFIGRNYARDAHGRWYFQNGPQRVFVGLDYTPYVLHLGAGNRWETQAGAPAGPVREILFDEDDRVVLAADCGPGLVIDRDLAALLDGLGDNGGGDAEQLLQALGAPGQTRAVRLFGAPVLAARVSSSDLPARFGYVREPAAQKT